MTNKLYLDFIIQGACFSIEESPDSKKKSALESLKKIEIILRNGLAYEGDNPNYAQLSPERLQSLLREKAEFLREKFFQKSSHVSGFSRFFGKVKQKEREIDQVFNQISPPSFLELPREIKAEILDRIPTDKLGKMGEVNKDGYHHTALAAIRRADKYGYKTRDAKKAIGYVKSLRDRIHSLIEKRDIRTEYVVYNKGRIPFFRTINLDATLEKIKSYAKKEPHFLTTTLRGYVKSGDLGGAALLLHLGADINSTNAAGETPLHLAVREQNKEMVSLLLDRRAKPNLQSLAGNTPLHLAKGEKEIITLLLDYGADITIVNSAGYTPFFYGTLEVFPLFFTRGQPVNQQGTVNGVTLLHYAVKQKRIELVTNLLKFGANPNIQNNNGETPLHRAAQNREEQMVALLLEHGADSSIVDM